MTLAFAPGLLILLALLNTHTIPGSLSRREIGTWTYSIVEGDGEDLRARTLNLARNGMGVYSTSTSLPSLVTFQADGSVSVKELFGQGAALQGKLVTTDISGDDLPDVLLVSSCGCSAGFNDYHLLSLDTKVKEIFTIENQIGMWEFDDRDGDRIPEFITREWLGDSDSLNTTSVAIVLKYDSGDLKLASELMRKRAPSEHEFLTKVAKDKRKSKSNESSGPDDSFIAELVFGGNGELAHRYLDLVLADEPKYERGFYWSLIFENMAS